MTPNRVHSSLVHPSPEHSRTAQLWTRRSAVSFGVASAAALLLGCTTTSEDYEDSSDAGKGGNLGKVLVIGAGPAGLSTAHLLRQRGVDVVVLEAQAVHGGRTRLDHDFVDFPIPLGAEWVHVEAEILEEAVNDSSIEVTTDLVAYTDEAQLAWYEDGLEYGPLDDLSTDLKFVDSGWLDFFDQHIVPGVADIIQYNTVVTKVEHSSVGVKVTDADGTVYDAERVVVTVPLKLLQKRTIEFLPALEDDRLEIIDNAPVWSGLKAFFVFDEAFYPTVLTMPGDETSEGQRLFYDAAYGQDTDFHVLGLFAVGHWAEYYQSMSSDELLAVVLQELDGIFAGAATGSYVRHIVQDWNSEPYAQAAYLADDAPSSISARLARPVGDSLHFAGDAYTNFDDWSSVHTAIRSASETVDLLMS